MVYKINFAVEWELFGFSPFLCGSLKSFTQISLVQTNLPFCNQKTESTQWVSDTIGRNFEVNLNVKIYRSVNGGDTSQLRLCCMALHSLSLKMILSCIDTVTVILCNGMTLMLG